eukprot:COSAG01_NODE_1_length_100484_cov_170.446142_111_plen_152_part_00
MDELLGLIEALEGLILDAKRIPMTNKVVIEEERLLQLTNKMRDFIKSNGAVIQQEVITKQQKQTADVVIKSEDGLIKPKVSSDKATQDLMTQAYAEVETLKAGSQHYADEVLSRLQMIITKTENDMLRMKRTIENGRQLIEERKNSIKLVG